MVTDFGRNIKSSVVHTAFDGEATRQNLNNIKNMNKEWLHHSELEVGCSLIAML